MSKIVTLLKKVHDFLEVVDTILSAIIPALEKFAAKREIKPNE